MDTTIIYSLKNGKWKEISHFPCALPLYDWKLLNGSLHWVAGDYSTSLDSWKIISLDLAKETYGEILQPEYEDGKPLLRFGLQLLIYDSKGSSSSVIENKCYDACIVVESLASPFPPLGLADNNIPSNVLKSLESIRSRFFNGQDSKSRKVSWVKWDKILTSKDKGGLGVPSLYALNRGESGGQTCWMSIVKEVKVLKGRGVNVLDFIRLKLGNGESSSFWDDKWYEGGVIKELFPRLYALETYKNATVSMKLMASSIDHSFRRSVRSGVEESQFNSLLEIVQVTNLVPCEDRYRWFLESDGVFSVASIRKLIDEQRFQEVGLSTRWVKSVPSKVNITAWKIKTNALPTRFNLSCRGMDIDSIMCPICNGGVETTSHLFFQCELVRQIMRKISIWWNVDYADVSSYEEWLAWLVSIRIQIKLKGMMEGVFYGLWWSIWNFRNKILFEDKPPKKALLFDNLVSNSFNWCKYRCKASFKWDDWLKNPYLVCV
ncbi:RNA-directed DNA polymerase, eukaryota [Tanacetum coccineum]